MRWEYYSIHSRFGDNELMNKLGEDRWELISTHVDPESMDGPFCIYIFKRPKHPDDN